MISQPFQTQLSCYTRATLRLTSISKRNAFMLGQPRLNKSALSPFPFWLVNMDLQHTAIVAAAAAFSRVQYTRTVRHSCLSCLSYVPSQQIHPISHLKSLPSLPQTGYMKNFKCSVIIGEIQWHSLIAEKMSMGYSQLIQWNFQSIFWSGCVVKRGDNSSVLDLIRWKTQGHHDLQTITNPLNFKVQSYFPDTEPNSAATMNVSQPQQLIKFCCLSVDRYLLAAVILW